MNIIRFKGGLGNQMFQYAFGVAMEKYGKTVAFDTEFYRRHRELRQFELKKVFPSINFESIGENEYRLLEREWEEIKKNQELLRQNITDVEKRAFYIEEGHSKYKDDVWSYKNCVYVGYWQTEKYFHSVEESIRKDFSFSVCDDELKSRAEYIQQNKMYGVHIRRGDFVGTQHEVCDRDYYCKAIQYIKEKNANARFVFFSDDLKWVSEQKLQSKNDLIQNASEFRNYQDWYDMYLMTMCQGIIISNSSFSWWGAWLAGRDKLVIAPRKWYMHDVAPDIYCANWVKI